MAIVALIALSVAGGVLACGTDRANAAASVVFVLDAPLCSSQLPVVFSIDSVAVATDTFRVHLTPSHTESRPFSTPAGHHTLGARVIGGYVWADKSVTLSAGETFQDSLPFYCS